MEHLTIDGATLLSAEDTGSGYASIILEQDEDATYVEGVAQIFLTYGEVKKLAQWLTEWMKENEDKKDE